MKALCIGQASYDITLLMDTFPIENKKFRTKDKIECGGGSASNCAYLLSKWGMDSFFAGVVGKDNYGENIKKEFLSVNTGLKYYEERENTLTTSSYIIATMDKGSRTILSSRKVKEPLKIPYEKDSYDLIVLDGYEKDFALEVLKNNPEAITVLDAGSLKESTVELGHHVKYLACSNDFAREYTNMPLDYNNLKTLVPIYDKLKEDFGCEIIITLEEHGCFIKTDKYKVISSIRVEVKDSTAAGDIFHGALAYFLANGYGLEEAVKLANITGALSVTKVGGRNSIPTLHQVKEIYNRVFAK